MIALRSGGERDHESFAGSDEPLTHFIELAPMQRAASFNPSAQKKEPEEKKRRLVPRGSNQP
jgi:hypothetical protein